MANTEDRFVKTYEQLQIIGMHIEIWVDKLTGVNYLFSKIGNAGGLTPLLNRDGTPIITSVPKEEE